MVGQKLWVGFFVLELIRTLKIPVAANFLLEIFVNVSIGVDIVRHLPKMVIVARNPVKV
jgi:hypothetical protein